MASRSSRGMSGLTACSGRAVLGRRQVVSVRHSVASVAQSSSSKVQPSSRQTQTRPLGGTKVRPISRASAMESSVSQICRPVASSTSQPSSVFRSTRSRLVRRGRIGWSEATTPIGRRKWAIGARRRPVRVIPHAAVWSKDSTPWREPGPSPQSRDASNTSGLNAEGRVECWPVRYGPGRIDGASPRGGSVRPGRLMRKALKCHTSPPRAGMHSATRADSVAKSENGIHAIAHQSSAFPPRWTAVRSPAKSHVRCTRRSGASRSICRSHTTLVGVISSSA